MTNDLKEDYAFLQTLLFCHTCTYVDMWGLYRRPCCEHPTRPHFGAMNHDAQRDGRCPYWKQATDAELKLRRENWHKVLQFGQVAVMAEEKRKYDQREAIKEHQKHLREGLV